MLKFSRALLGSALLATASVVAVPAFAERPVGTFARVPDLEEPTISPNGKMLAANVAVEAEQRLVVYPIDGVGRSSTIALGDSNVSNFFWVNDDWLLIEVAQPDNSLGQTMVVTRLIAFNAQTQEMVRIKAREMGQLASDVIWVAKDGTPRILLSYQTSFYSSDPGFFPEVSMVDVSRNKFDKVQASREGVFDWIADPDGNVRIGLGSERGGRQSRVLYREATGGGFKEIGNTAKDENLPLPIALLSQPGKAVAFSDKDGADAAYTVDLGTMALGEALVAVKGYDLDSVLLDKSGWNVAGLRYIDTRPRTVWLDQNFAAIQTSLERALGRQVSFVSRSRDDSRIVVRAFDAQRPSSYYLLTVADQKLALLGHENPELSQTPLAPMRTVPYVARDGMALNAILTLPQGREAKGLPIIVLPHGGPGVRDYEGWDWWVQFLVDRGYAVIQPNYRGSRGFGTALHKAGDGEWGLKMQDDVDDALAWAVEKGIADPKRACIAGASYGGFVAMRAAERNPELYRCAISFAGVSDLEKMLTADRQFYNQMATIDYWKGRTPDFAAVSPIHRPEKAGIPILVMHGRRDLRVPVAQSKQYADALRRAGKPVTYIEQPKGDHHFSRMEDRQQFLEEMEMFLDKYNPA
jgi:dienelactone hydrolase